MHVHTVRRPPTSHSPPVRALASAVLLGLTPRSPRTVKALAPAWLGLLPPGTRLFGENMTGIHSIEYDGLASYFYLFGVQASDGEFAAWEDVQATAELLGVPTAPEVFTGEFATEAALEAFLVQQAGGPSRASSQAAAAVQELPAPAPERPAEGVPCPEGFVVRLAGSFPAAAFEGSMGKYVRKGHVQTGSDWLRTWKKATLAA